MRRLIRTILTLAFVVAAVIVAALLFGPREPLDLTRARPVEVGADVTTWLTSREAQVDGIVPGAEKTVIWAGEPGQTTAVSVVYLHGFSASLQEIRPVPDLLAEALGANLFYTRLSGHGMMDGTAMADATPDQWLDDTAEAIAVGRAIGNRVILIGTSTGGTLAALAAADPRLSKDLAGVVFVSPNFRVNAAGAELLALPFARSFAPLLLGPERSSEPTSEAHGRWWTTAYPSTALVPMASVVKAADGIDYHQIKLPALFIFSRRDQVVDPVRTAEVADLWGGPVELLEVTPGPGDDPGGHVIAGDIRSPGLTPEVAGAMIDWSRKVLAAQ